MNNNPPGTSCSPADFVAAQNHEQSQRQQEADACVANWNAVHEAIGSFADEHTTL